MIFEDEHLNKKKALKKHLYQAGVLQPDCGRGAGHLLHGDGARAGDQVGTNQSTLAGHVTIVITCDWPAWTWSMMAGRESASCGCCWWGAAATRTTGRAAAADTSPTQPSPCLQDRAANNISQIVTILRDHDKPVFKCHLKLGPLTLCPKC